MTPEELLAIELRSMGRGGELIDSAILSDGEGHDLTFIVYRMDGLDTLGRVMHETRWACSNRTSGILHTRWGEVWDG